MLGVAREMLLVKFLGVGAISDAFLTAFKIPNSLRKIFAEGALSAAFVPTFVTILRTDRPLAHSLMSLAFVVFEGGLLVICGFIIFFASSIVATIAPGFSAEQIAFTVPFLRILIPFIFFISSSALLAGALQAVGHFFVPAFGSIILNVIFITGILICWFWQLPVICLCFFVLFAGFVQFMQHLHMYLRLHFTFKPITRQTCALFSKILAKFGMCLASMSVMEVNLFIDTAFASFLPPGTISLMYYANRFMGIPLGVFAVAFSTILLQHFSRLSVYAPKRLNFYLLESAKLVFWVTAPCTLAMFFFADEIFSTLFLSQTFTMEKVRLAGIILRVFVTGLFFFSFNKIILNVYYAIHETKIPAMISIIVTTSNLLLNTVFMNFLGAPGIALATTLSGILQTILLVYCLRRYCGFHAYAQQFWLFAARYTLALSICSIAFYSAYKAIFFVIGLIMPPQLAPFFLYKFGFWMWVGPLCLLSGLLLYWNRGRFKIRLYFLD